jgi:uncharacterized protein DUF3768
MAGEQSPQPNPIARLNDEFRRSGRDVMVTPGVQALPDMLGLIQAVQTFDRFTPDNNPYGEHDFGSIKWHGEKTYWKINYYDQALQYWHDPLSPDCRRILTILLASEY